MIRIAVCDENERDCYAHRDLFRNILNEYGTEYKIDLFFDSERLFRALHDRLFDLIVTDFTLNGQDMTEFVQSLYRERYPIRTLFVSAKKEGSCLSIPNLGVYKKPLTEETVRAVTDYISDFRVLSRRLYIAAKNGEKYRISETDIRYIEVFHNDLCIHLADRKIICRSTLGGFLNRLCGAVFVRCHQSYAVNLSLVTSVRRYHAVLNEGENVPISKNRYPYVRDCFFAQERKTETVSR